MNNKSELKAMLIIANKMNWQNKPVVETIETINQMVRNQQALELDTIGECDDYEETLLSIALWDADKILSCLYVYDYYSLHIWYGKLFCEDMGITSDDLMAMIDYAEHSAELIAMQAEDEMEEYYDEMYFAMLDTLESLRY